MNMKLTNLSLSVLVALGLVACGGSSNKNDAPVDPVNPPVNPNKPETKPTEPKDGEHVVKDPTNSASKETEQRFKNDKEVAAAMYTNRIGRDTLAGYGKGMKYENGSTSDKDIQREISIVPYLKAGWINSKGTLRLNPLQTYVVSKDSGAEPYTGFYTRIVAVTDETKSKVVNWEDASRDSVFLGADGKEYTADQLLFIPNVKGVDLGEKSADKKDFTVNTGITAADFNDPSKVGVVEDNGDFTFDKIKARAIKPGANGVKKGEEASFDSSRGNVIYSFIRVGADDAGNGGKEYSLAGNTSKLDLGELPAGKLVAKNIDLGYTILDTKGTPESRDDDSINKVTKAGELRIYDLNYSRATLEVNQAAREDSDDPTAAARNGLGLGGKISSNPEAHGNVVGQGSNGAYGPYQIKGAPTLSIPKNGRAQYVGQSFGVNSVGNIELEADFAADRAGIKGTVTNRHTYGKGGEGKKALSSLTLGKIVLTQPGFSETSTAGINSNSQALNGIVVKDGENWGTWAVGLYGPNAENAAGVIAIGHEQETSKPATGTSLTGKLDNVVEVFNAVRGDIKPRSLNNPDTYND